MAINRAKQTLTDFPNKLWRIVATLSFSVAGQKRVVGERGEAGEERGVKEDMRLGIKRKRREGVDYVV